MLEPTPGSAVSTPPNPHAVPPRPEPTAPKPAPAQKASTRRTSGAQSPTPSAENAEPVKEVAAKTTASEDGGQGALAPRIPEPERPDRADGHRNEVYAVGRVTAAPSERELPSGDRLVTWRICVARPEVPGRRARADSLTLVSFDPQMCDRVHGWRVGDVVRVSGELRRRIWRGWNGIRSVLEVEVDSAALVRGAGR